MYLARCFRNSSFFIRKEAFSTSFVLEQKKKNSEAKVSNNVENDKDRSEKISVETSISYLKSKAYAEAYGDDPVWTFYRRNYKGGLPPETRETCIRQNVITSASPCPICRDKYLVVDYKNIDLIKQFVSPFGEYILPTKKTGVCQKQQKNLMVAIAKARDYGFLTFHVPHRHYNYEYYKNLK